MPRWFAAAIVISATLSTVAFGQDPGDAAGITVFRTSVRPLFVDQCVQCHNPDAKKGGLDLSRRGSALAGGKNGAAIVVGNSDDSLIFQKVTDGEMPPKSPLKPEQVESIKRWIEHGAPYDDEPVTRPRAGVDWWSLKPIKDPTPPTVRDSAWVRNAIDAFILNRLEAAGLRPAREADNTTLIRRVSFDLIGLPPTPAEIQQFVADTAPNAYERVVDRLLASPQYGERWARHWLDVARFGESHGYETNALRPTAWPYRDYVIRAFNDDIPFGQFVMEQLAGDRAAAANDWLAQSATGFLVGGAHDVVGNQTIEGMRQQRADDLDDIVATVSAAFLGLTVNCARCHDHKFDPITQRDYYGMQAVFAGVQHADRPIVAPDANERGRKRAALEKDLADVMLRLDAAEPLTGPNAKQTRRSAVNPKRNVERFLATRARFLRLTVLATSDGIEPCIDELEVFGPNDPNRNLARAEGVKTSASSVYPNSEIHRLEHLNDGKHGNSRSWISREPGKGSVTLEFPSVQVIDKVVWGRDREEKFTDRLATRYQIEIAAEPDQWIEVASSDDRAAKGDVFDRTEDARRLQRLSEQIKALSDTISVYAGTFAQPASTHILRRGDPMQPAAEVSPSGIDAVSPRLELPATSTEYERREALARWIADPRNPLPPRVRVNRLWQYHFGTGIVATPSDFGFNGAPPSHPELLDWLARRLLENGGRLKPLHRMIVTSATYRQSSVADEATIKADAQNRLLGRMTMRRLDAETLRDSILAVSGRLDPSMGGPGYSLWEKNTNYVVVFTPRYDLESDAFRRMIYQFKPRSQPDPTFGVFDCPDAALAVPRRANSTTALQALSLLNSRFLIAQSSAFAARLSRETSSDAADQATRAFWLAFGRAPSRVELAGASSLIREHGAEAFCRAIYNASEFSYAP